MWVAGSFTEGQALLGAFELSTVETYWLLAWVFSAEVRPQRLFGAKTTGRLCTGALSATAEHTTRIDYDEHWAVVCAPSF